MSTKTFPEPAAFSKKPRPDIPLTPVTSSQVKAIGYDPLTKTLACQFTHGAGHLYVYPNVEPRVHADFMAAKSIGKFFGQHIKALPFEKFEAEAEKEPAAARVMGRVHGGIPEASRGRGARQTCDGAGTQTYGMQREKCVNAAYPPHPTTSMENQEMNPAALTAALRGDLANALIASTPGGIERQEAAGQRTLVASAMLPKEINGATREQLTAIGFKFGADVDDLFVTCELPAGWTKRGTDHSMHSDLLDDQGRKRAGIFYKAAFYDRRANMVMHRRYCVESWRDGGGEKTRRIDITDGDQVIKEFGEVGATDWDGRSALEAQAKAWLTDNHPGWENPLACW